MFIYKRQIHLSETDATGVLYFSEQFKLSLEALETYFFSENFTLQMMLENCDFLMPIVHAEADFTAPLRVGDHIEILLSIFNIGTSAFTVQSYLQKKNQEVGTVKITHVTTSKKTGKSIPIPEQILIHLRQLGSLQRLS